MTVDDVAPYSDPEQHLRDEIWRIWLRLEYEIRRRWEWESIPRLKSDTGLGVWKPRDIAGIFRAAQVEYRESGRLLGMTVERWFERKKARESKRQGKK